MDNEQTKLAAEVMSRAEYNHGYATNVQVKELYSELWVDCNSPCWNWVKFRYRIKPKYVYKAVYGEYLGNASYDTPEEVKKDFCDCGGTDILRYEVIDGKPANFVLLGNKNA